MGTPAETTVLERFHKSRDVETHLRAVRVDGVSALELRDYIPSSDRYGRGYWIPEEISEALGAAIAKKR